MGIWFPRITHTLLKRRHALAPGCFSADRCRDAVFCLARSYFWDLAPNKSSHLIFLVWGVMKVRCDDKQPLGLQISWAESLKRPAKMLGIETDYLGVCKCSIIRKLVEVSLFVCVCPIHHARCDGARVVLIQFPFWWNARYFKPYFKHLFVWKFHLIPSAVRQPRRVYELMSEVCSLFFGKMETWGKDKFISDTICVKLLSNNQSSGQPC